MTLTYTEFNDHKNALKDAEIHLQHIYKEIEDEDMDRTSITINSGTLCHCLELLLAMAATYEGYIAGGVPMEIGEVFTQH